MLIAHSILLFKGFDENTGKFLPARFLKEYPINPATYVPQDIQENYSLKDYFLDADQILARADLPLEQVSPQSLLELRWYTLPSGEYLTKQGLISDPDIGPLTHTAEPLWLSFDNTSDGDLRVLSTADAVVETLNQMFFPRYRLYQDTPDGTVRFIREFTDDDFNKDDAETVVTDLFESDPTADGAVKLLSCTEYPPSVVLFDNSGIPLCGSKCYWDSRIRDSTPFEYCEKGCRWNLQNGKIID